MSRVRDSRGVTKKPTQGGTRNSLCRRALPVTLPGKSATNLWSCKTSPLNLQYLNFSLCLQVRHLHPVGGAVPLAPPPIYSIGRGGAAGPLVSEPGEKRLATRLTRSPSASMPKNSHPMTPAAIAKANKRMAELRKRDAARQERMKAELRDWFGRFDDNNE